MDSEADPPLEGPILSSVDGYYVPYISESEWIPPSMQPWEPVDYYLPEISSARVVVDRPWLGGRQVILKFANGYGMSIVNHWGAYGGLEIAWLNENGDLWDPFETGDTVRGYLTQRDLIEEISRTHQLPRRTHAEPDDGPGKARHWSDPGEPLVPEGQGPDEADPRSGDGRG